MGRDSYVDTTSPDYQEAENAGMMLGMALPLPGAKVKLLQGLQSGKLGHIFRIGRGHVNPRTVSSQNRYMNLFQRTINPANFRSTKNGVSFYTQTQRNGKQIWVEVYNGKISNAGVNLRGAHR
jgi:hypothetical protein